MLRSAARGNARQSHAFSVHHRISAPQARALLDLSLLIDLRAVCLVCTCNANRVFPNLCTGPVLDLSFLIDHVMMEIKPLHWQEVIDSDIPLKVPPALDFCRLPSKSDITRPDVYTVVHILNCMRKCWQGAPPAEGHHSQVLEAQCLCIQMLAIRGMKPRDRSGTLASAAASNTHLHFLCNAKMSHATSNERWSAGEARRVHHHRTPVARQALFMYPNSKTPHVPGPRLGTVFFSRRWWPAAWTHCSRWFYTICRRQGGPCHRSVL